MKKFLCTFLVALSCATIAAPENYPLHAAAKSGDAKEIERLLTEKICGVNDRNDYGGMAIHYAAGMGHLECLKVLLAHGANVFVTTFTGNTPIHLAAWWGRLECVEYLVIEAGVTVDAKDNDGDTPKDLAVQQGKQDVVEFFNNYQELPTTKGTEIF